MNIFKRKKTFGFMMARKVNIYYKKQKTTFWDSSAFCSADPVTHPVKEKHSLSYRVTVKCL